MNQRLLATGYKVAIHMIQNMLIFFSLILIENLQNFKEHLFWTGGIAQAVEYLLCKHEALSSKSQSY
jgi:hypothetical protein